MYRQLDLNEELTFEASAAFLDDASIDVDLFNLGSRKRASPRKPTTPYRAPIRSSKKSSNDDGADDTDSTDDQSSCDAEGDADSSCSDSGEESDQCPRTSIKRKHSVQTGTPNAKRPALTTATVTAEKGTRKRKAASSESEEDSAADSAC